MLDKIERSSGGSFGIGDISASSSSSKSTERMREIDYIF
jgi:hypothetical protein